MTERAEKGRYGLLVIGLLLVGAGLVFTLGPIAGRAGQWASQLLPMFLILAGAVRVASFAFYRKPRSPIGGMLLLLLGAAWLAGRHNPSLGLLGVYGKYWPALLLLFGSIELIRYYTHRDVNGQKPRLFSAGRLAIIFLIAATGVAANQLSARSPSFLAVDLQGVFHDIQESVAGRQFSFSDAPVAIQVPTGVKITVNNSFGDLKVVGGSAVRASLTKRVRAVSEEQGREVADRVRLVFNQTSQGCTISTNRDEVDRDVNTDIELEVPPSMPLEIITSFGNVNATRIGAPVWVNAQHGSVDLSRVSGDLNVKASYCDVDASEIEGNLTIAGAKRVRVSKVEGAADLAASNGSVEVKNVTGPVTVDAPFCSVVAESLTQLAKLRTEHSSVRVARATDVVVDAPHSDVRAESIGGSLVINSSSGGIHLRDIARGLKILGERSSVTADDIRGPVEITTSHGDVSLRNFYDRVRVKTTHKSVKLVADIEPEADIEVENDRGEIKLVLPSTSEFELDAISRNGRIKQSGFGFLPQGTRESVSYALGIGAPRIRLRTSYKNIVIEGNGNARSLTGRVEDKQ